MFVPRPDLQTSFIPSITSGQLTVLEMVNQRSRLSVHLMQWLKGACSSNTECLSIQKGLQDVFMGRRIGCEISNTNVWKLLGRHCGFQ